MELAAAMTPARRPTASRLRQAHNAAAGRDAAARVESVDLSLARMARHLDRRIDVTLADCNPQAVHELRVAAARLAAMLDGFAGAPVAGMEALRENLRWLRHRSSAARDWDALLQDRKLWTTAARHGQGLKNLQALALTERTRAADGIAVAVRTRRCLSLQEVLYGLAAADRESTTAPTRPQGSRDIRDLDQGLKLVCKQAPPRTHFDLERQHKLRKAVKHLRYRCELQHDAANEAGATYIGQLIELQNTLGNVRDAVVGRRLLHRLMKGQDRRLKAAAGDLRHTLAGRRHRLERRFHKLWKTFENTKPFWTPAA